MATTISSAAALKQHIKDLEIKRNAQKMDIATHLKEVVESVKPKNLIRAGLMSISEAPVLRQNLINSVLSLTTGWVAKKLAVPKSNTLIQKTVGAAVQYGVTRFMATPHNPLSNLLSEVVNNFKHRRR